MIENKMFFRRLSRRAVLVAGGAAAALTLTGCLNLAPKYEQPSAPAETTSSWSVSPHAAGLKEGEVVVWKRFFLDPRLQQVIRLALDNNRDLRQSMLEVERLRQLYRVSRAELFPTVGAAASAAHQRASVDTTLPGASRISHAYSANLAMASYELDLFGKIRNLNEQALQAYFASEDARRSAQNTLIAEVATVWLSIGADHASLDLARKTLSSQTESFRLVEQSYNAGTANKLELNQAKEIVASAKTAVQTAINALNQDKNAMRLLAGAEVSENLLPTKIELGATLPASMPAGLPSEVLLRRPDISIAERNLRAANANIGVARAAFFPSITLTSSIGTLSTDMSNLFEGGRGTWGFTPSITLPIFTGGANTANLAAARVYQKEQIAAYEKAIQVAFREVNDALSTESTITKRLDAQNEMVDAAVEAYDLAQLRYRHGVDSFLSVLDSQRTMFSAQQAQIQTRLARAVSIVTLYKVLGGGQEIEETVQAEKENRTS
ncbi:MAG: efflux transporter outer membrane subunit [Sutterellaceae bacterium]|nr:efflux transporter outer membrane subunit [Sutterellaceae bacterium]MDY2869258.1 efflux transporter outer membrane subunit [Mesosutterella sp.]